MAPMSLPQVQKAAVLHGPYGQRHQLDNAYPVTPPGTGEVLIRMEAAGICSGDINPRDGHLPAPPEAVRPLVIGHEGLGRIVAVGEQVQGFEVGDRVGMGWKRSTCHECQPCRSGRDNLCQTLVINGYVKDGTFQEYATIPASDLIRIPESTRSAAELAPLLCAGGTALAGVRSASVAPGGWICITGAAGGVGSLAVQYAKHFQCRVIAVDSEKKRDYCQSLGVDLFVDYEHSDTVVKRIVEASAGGVQGTVMCTANQASYSQALFYSGVGASIVSIGPAMVQVHTGLMMVKGLHLMGQGNGTRKDIEDALSLSNDNIVPAVQVVPLAAVDEALDKLIAGSVVGRQVIVFDTQG